MKICSVEGCEKKSRGLGLCQLHYGRKRRAERVPLAADSEHHGTITGYITHGCRCRPCHGAQRDYLKVWHRDNPEAYRRHNKTRQLRAVYGLEYADFVAMKERQGNLCAICRGPQVGGREELCVDHCHETGKIRGLLCTNCNSGIGLLKDDLETVLAAVDYLLVHSEAIPVEVVA